MIFPGKTGTKSRDTQGPDFAESHCLSSFALKDRLHYFHAQPYMMN